MWNWWQYATLTLHADAGHFLVPACGKGRGEGAWGKYREKKTCDFLYCYAGFWLAGYPDTVTNGHLEVYAECHLWGSVWNGTHKVLRTSVTFLCDSMPSVVLYIFLFFCLPSLPSSFFPFSFLFRLLLVAQSGFIPTCLLQASQVFSSEHGQPHRASTELLTPPCNCIEVLSVYIWWALKPLPLQCCFLFLLY